MKQQFLLTKEFFKPTKAKLVAPLAIFLYFILVNMFLEQLDNDLVVLALPGFVLSLPFIWLLKPLGLWNTTAFFDSSGPTFGGFMLVMVIWIVIAYLIGCCISYLGRRIKE